MGISSMMTSLMVSTNVFTLFSTSSLWQMMPIGHQRVRQSFSFMFMTSKSTSLMLQVGKEEAWETVRSSSVMIGKWSA